MKFTTIAASLCVLGSASAFVFPAAARPGVTTRLQDATSDAVETTAAREALIGSASMAELLKLVGAEGQDEPATEAAAPPAPPATEAAAPPADN